MLSAQFIGKESDHRQVAPLSQVASCGKGNWDALVLSLTPSGNVYWEFLVSGTVFGVVETVVIRHGPEWGPSKRKSGQVLG